VTGPVGASETPKSEAQSITGDFPPSVLLIDDEPFLLRALSYVLTQEGYAVAMATDGAQGLNLVRQMRPRLAIVDVMMPVTDGYEVCEEIKADPSLENTRVILLSARGQASDVHRGLLSGADDYMTKPFSPRAIVRRVRDLLQVAS
jgi:DNA-binding response OmpR family regulator